MIYVGIDIAKLNHYAAAISSDGEVLLEPFKFTNDNDGFCLLVSKFSSLETDQIIIGLDFKRPSLKVLLRSAIFRAISKIKISSNFFLTIHSWSHFIMLILAKFFKGKHDKRTVPLSG